MGRCNWADFIEEGKTRAVVWRGTGRLEMKKQGLTIEREQGTLHIQKQICPTGMGYPRGPYDKMCDIKVGARLTGMAE